MSINIYKIYIDIVVQPEEIAKINVMDCETAEKRGKSLGDTLITSEITKIPYSSSATKFC